MKREIKFRGLGVKLEGWLYGSLIGGDTLVGGLVDFNDEYFNTEYWYKVQPDTIGQYTGLKDKNGTEIYEGDVIKVERFKNNSLDLDYEERELFDLKDLRGVKERETISNVVFEEGSFLYKSSDSLNFYDTFLGEFYHNMKHSQPVSTVEVIGNIHETK